MLPPFSSKSQVKGIRRSKVPTSPQVKPTRMPGRQDLSASATLSKKHFFHDTAESTKAKHVLQKLRHQRHQPLLCNKLRHQEHQERPQHVLVQNAVDTARL
jgi:hypothetical protein